MSIPRIASYSYSDLEPELQKLQNKVQWQVDAQRAVLLVHDMQNYFVNFYGREQEPVLSLLKQIRALTDLCRTQNIPVVYTAQPPDQKPEDRALLTDFWGSGLTRQNHATAIVDELKPESQDIQYTKWRYSAYQRTALQQDMQAWGRDQLIVCGIYAHIGILATALEGFMRDIQTFVVADAVADFSAQDHTMALTYIAQRCGKVESLTALRQALSDAHPRTELSLPSLKKDIAEILMMPESDIRADDNLMDLGLDSIRLMALVETWRKQGARVDFADLAEAATLSQWWRLINPQAVAQGVESHA